MGEIAPGSRNAATAAGPGIREPAGLRLRYALASLLFTVAYHLFGLRRAVTRQNLQRSFPGLDATSLRRLQREFVRRQAEVFAEMTYGASIDAEELRARVRIVGDDLLAAASGPRPLILAAAHQCNFEWVVLRISLDLGPRLLALYKPLSNAWAERLFKRWRTRFGATLVPAKSVLRELARFREAAAIGIVADQVPRTQPREALARVPAPGHGVLHGPRAARAGTPVAGRLRLDAPARTRPLRNRAAAAERGRREAARR